MEKSLLRRVLIVGVSSILVLVWLTACQEENITQVDDEEPINTEENYWSMIDVSFAIRTWEGMQPNYTEFADFNSDGYVDIIKSSYEDGLVLYSNSGSGSFFTQENSRVIFDPADVDLGALGHWGTEMEHTSTFALADYDQDGFLDAVVEGPFNGNTMDPVILFARGDSEKLYPVSYLEVPFYQEGQYYDGFTIFGSYFFPLVNTEQVAYSHIPYPSSNHRRVWAFEYSSDCENNIFRNVQEDQCNPEFIHKLGGPHRDAWKPYSTIEYDYAETLDDSYVVFANHLHAISAVNGPTIPYILIPRYWRNSTVVQSDIGNFGSGYDLIHTIPIYEHVWDNPEVVNVILIVKDFETISIDDPEEKLDEHLIEYYVETTSDAYLMGATVFDYNHDGKDDIIVSLKKGTELEIVALENKGNYEFVKSDLLQKFSISSDQAFVRLKKNDFNNDGKMDLYLQGAGKILINN